MKRAGYKEAIFWIVANDDTEWLKDEELVPSVTACLVQDLFGVTTEKVIADLRRETKRQRP